MTDETKKWLADQFGISVDDIVWFNGGTCYDSIIVKTKEAADKVTNAVKDETVNGGYFHGMPLGGQENSDGNIRVMC